MGWAQNAPDYVARARALGPAIAAAADDTERGRELPAPLVSTLAANGLFRLLQPSALGGAELTPMQFAEVMEELAKWDASTAWCLGQGNGCGAAAAYLDPAVAREIFGPDDGIVAWGPPSGSAEAKKVPGGYRLTGSWSFASGSHNATWFGAPYLRARRRRCAAAAGRRRHDPAHAAVPKAKAVMTDIWKVLGLRGTGSDAYSVTDLFVADDHTRAARPHDPRAPSPAGFTASASATSTPRALPGSHSASPAPSMTALSRWPPRRPRAAAPSTLRHNNVVQSQVAQSEARLRSAAPFC